MSEQNVLGFTSPHDFPVESYHAIQEHLNRYPNTHKVQVSLFRLGWNGLTYRYRSMIEYDNEFTISVKKFGNSPPHEERYKQGKALFGFFVNAVSVIECFFFSTYFMASILKPEEFPFSGSKELKSIYPKHVASNFTRYFPKYNLTNVMNKCISADTYKQICDMRDVLSHRGMLPHNFDVGGETDGMVTMPINPKASSNQWQFDFSVDEQTSTLLRNWLSDTLDGLISSSVDFCTQRLS